MIVQWSTNCGKECPGCFEEFGFLDMTHHRNGIIRPYTLKEAQLQPYDPLYPEVAANIIALIKANAEGVSVEHVGSTAIGQCEGKGIIDLMVLYTEGNLEKSKESLYSLGFQSQPHEDPFGQDRPMLVGSIQYAGRLYPIHVHVIRQDSEEAKEMIRFRHVLRRNSRLRESYIRCKRKILEIGTKNSAEYSKAKGSFVEQVLRTR